MTCTCNCLSPFLWRTNTAPSIFTDKAFTGNASGKTSSQVSSESADAYQQRHGRSLGTLVGISPAADALQKSTYGRTSYEATRARVAARKGKAKG